MILVNGTNACLPILGPIRLSTTLLSHQMPTKHFFSLQPLRNSRPCFTAATSQRQQQANRSCHRKTQGCYTLIRIPKIQSKSLSSHTKIHSPRSRRPINLRCMILPRYPKKSFARSLALDIPPRIRRKNIDRIRSDIAQCRPRLSTKKKNWLLVS